MNNLLTCFKFLMADKGRIRQEEQMRESRDRVLDTHVAQIKRAAAQNAREADVYTEFVQSMQQHLA